MVGFGKFLKEVSSQHGVAKHSFDYHALKGELAALTGIREADDGDSQEDGSPEAEPVRMEPAADMEAASRWFRQKLEEELHRVNQIVKQKVKSLQRVRPMLDAARAMRGFRSSSERSIVLMQLSNIYDDVVLVLWFMYLNSIAVSKLVKKYNKNVPQFPYTVDPSRWLFLQAGFAPVQKMKADIENEVAACVDSATDESESLLVHGNSEIRAISESMQELMSEYKHHLFRHNDPTRWAVEPHLPQNRAQTRRRNARIVQMQEERVRVDAPRFNREFRIGMVVGRGAYGVVCKATHVRSGTLMAVKTIYDAWAHPILAQRTYREIQIMQQLHHPNIVPLHDVFISQNQRDVHLVMPFISHTCEDLLAKRQLLPQHKKWFMLQLLSALSYIHDRGVVHRDLKLSNILVDDQPMLYLTDFGLARTLSGGSETTMADNPDYVQTQWYRAPEVLLCSRKTTPASDMWSTGCILAELLTGVPLFPGQDDQQQLELIIACCPVPQNSRLNDEVRGHLNIGQDVDLEGGLPAVLQRSNGNSSNGDTDTVSGRDSDDSAGVPQGRGAGSGGRRLRAQAAAAAAAAEDLQEHVQQVQVTSEVGGLRRGSRNIVFRRSLEEVLSGCAKLGMQEDFPREHVVDLLKRMLQFEPSARLTSKAALQHPWFTEEGSLPPAGVREAHDAAVPKCGEEAVRLELPCTKLYTAAQYRQAVEKGPQVSLRREQQLEVVEHNAAAGLIQRFWRWRRRGGARPLLGSLPKKEKRRRNQGNRHRPGYGSRHALPDAQERLGYRARRDYATPPTSPHRGSQSSRRTWPGYNCRPAAITGQESYCGTCSVM